MLLYSADVVLSPFSRCLVQLNLVIGINVASIATNLIDDLLGDLHSRWSLISSQGDGHTEQQLIKVGCSSRATTIDQSLVEEENWRLQDEGRPDSLSLQPVAVPQLRGPKQVVRRSCCRWESSPKLNNTDRVIVIVGLQ